MLWSTVATIVAIFTVGVTCLPVDIEAPATDLLPPKVDSESMFATDYMPGENDYQPAPATDLMPPEVDGRPTLATDLMPPPLPEEMNEKKRPAMLFVINVIAVKNRTAEDSNDVLQNDVIDEVPSEVAVPLAFFLLVVEDEDESRPVSLDEIAKDLEEEGFAVEKVVKDGETRLVKVDLDSVETTATIPDANDDSINMLRPETKIQESGKLMSVRRKRSISLRSEVEELKRKIRNFA